MYFGTSYVSPIIRPDHIRLLDDWSSGKLDVVIPATDDSFFAELDARSAYESLRTSKAAVYGLMEFDKPTKVDEGYAVISHPTMKLHTLRTLLDRDLFVKAETLEVAYEEMLAKIEETLSTRVLFRNDWVFTLARKNATSEKLARGLNRAAIWRMAASPLGSTLLEIPKNMPHPLKPVWD